ncbi:hypothetical protein FACS189496_4650 [Bacilli bacterium]|nr:hypothetical protein FACS189496_4600 [Bacilli bacterium]GHU53344.1 hypothetical protein FACS189496_4650 [Bacilli bacterium]
MNFKKIAVAASIVVGMSVGAGAMDPPTSPDAAADIRNEIHKIDACLAKLKVWCEAVKAEAAKRAALDDDYYRCDVKGVKMGVHKSTVYRRYNTAIGYYHSLREQRKELLEALDSF